MTCGLLLLDKPLGLSSNAALQRVRRVFGRERAGHTGALDPLATGMLPICLGEATKIAGELLDGDKAYEFTLQLGERRSTGDREGEVVEAPRFRRTSRIGSPQRCRASWARPRRCRPCTRR